MAHADYHCCACCDAKLEYSEFSTAKERLCPDCIRYLFDATGQLILSGQELVDWIGANDKERVRQVLSACGFRLCYYSNEVDDAAMDVLGKHAFKSDRYLA